MTIKILSWGDLIPDTDSYQEIFLRANFKIGVNYQLHKLQPRLHYAFKQFLSSWKSSSISWLLIKSSEEIEYITILVDILRSLQSKSSILYGGEYYIKGKEVTFHSSVNIISDFVVKSDIITADLVEKEQLFGCLRYFNGCFSLVPGLVHKANGGVLLITIRTLLAKPSLWLRLKKIVTQQSFDWISFNESHPFPINIPAMPLSIKIILIGDRGSLANFEEIEPDLVQQAMYSEFEENVKIKFMQDIKQWCQWVISIAIQKKLPFPTVDAWPILIREAVRYTEDQEVLPLCPIWLTKQLREVMPISGSFSFNGEQFTKMLIRREWSESFLSESIQEEIFLNQILIETEGKRIGQINALSVIKFPGYPKTFGEPSRISCVVYIGDGDFKNIEHKSELSGNFHTKGMMIVQSFLMAQLHLDYQIPFSASLTFEQSYVEIDGDSASIAELCVLISALAGVPINQNIAITGSVDQFGRVHSVGGINEKVESFFKICLKRGLTGKQGVIIPIGNKRNICLNQEIIIAVKEKQFFIWAIEDIKDALVLLTNLKWSGSGKTTLKQIIQKRISNAVNQKDYKHRYSWPLFWTNWFRKE